MSQDVILRLLKTEIERYRDGLRSSIFNDQSQLRRQQAGILISLISQAQAELSDGYQPIDYSADINEIIIECRRTTIIGNSKLAELAGTLLERLNVLRKGKHPRPKKYKYIQCIGFYADVSALDNDKATNLGEAGSWARTMKYGGEIDDNLDILQKLTRFCAAIIEAECSQHLAKNSNILKVIMGPEFFLRGAKGSYSLENVAEILERLRIVTKDAKFKDWLFIPGTAIASMSQNNNNEEIFNVALIQRGGFDKADGIHESIVYKEFVSGIDFLSANKNPHDFGSKKMPNSEMPNPNYRKAVLGDSIKKIRATQGSRDFGGNNTGKLIKEDVSAGIGGSLAGGSVFVVDGVRFGLEVCLDHAKGRLKRAILGNENVRRIPPVDVQLIPSAGMRIMLNRVGTKRGGTVFNVDGLRPIADNAIDLAITDLEPPTDLNGEASTLIKDHLVEIKLQHASDAILIFPPTRLP